MHKVLPIKVLSNVPNVVFVQLGTIPWKSPGPDSETIEYPLVIMFTADISFSIVVIGRDVYESMVDSGNSLTIEQVITVYCELVLHKSDLPCADYIVMESATDHVSKMAIDFAKTCEDPISYLKLCLAKGLTVSEKLQDYLDDLANKRLIDKKARIIQRTFRKVIADPSYDMCRRRLLYEYETMPCLCASC